MPEQESDYDSYCDNMLEFHPVEPVRGSREAQARKVMPEQDEAERLWERYHALARSFGQRAAFRQIIAEERSAEREAAASFVEMLTIGAIPGAWTAKVADWLREGKHVGRTP
jgi:hypothetical protein